MKLLLKSHSGIKKTRARNSNAHNTDGRVILLRSEKTTILALVRVRGVISRKAKPSIKWQTPVRKEWNANEKKGGGGGDKPRRRGLTLHVEERVCRSRTQKEGEEIDKEMALAFI